MRSITNRVIFFLLVIMSTVAGVAQGAETIDEVVTYYHPNVVGSPMMASDDEGNVLWTQEYAPYGYRQDSPEQRGATALNRIGFTGHVEDKYVDRQLIYMQQRYYDPAIGRFLSSDPVSFQEDNPMSFNRYAYANNNPFRFVDPDGRWAEDIFVGVPSVGIGLYSLGSNLWNGNWGWAALDAGGIVADVGAILTPAVPGVAGLSIKAGRLAEAANSADTISDVAKSVNPNDIRFSQSSVNGTADLVESMQRNGFKGDAIDVVRMSDGNLTTLDNTRVLAASRAGVDVKARIHNANDAVPSSIAGRFKSRNGQTPTTFGEAALNRIGNQNSGFRRNNPLGSNVTGSVD